MKKVFFIIYIIACSYCICQAQSYKQLDAAQIDYLESIIPGFTSRYEIILKHENTFQPDSEKVLSMIMSDIESDSCIYFDDLNYFEAIKILCMHYFNEGNDQAAEEFLFLKRKYILESNASTIYNCVFDWMYGMLRLRQGKFEDAIVYLKSAADGYDSVRADEDEYIIICQNLALAYLSTSKIEEFDLEEQAVVAMTNYCDSIRDNFPQEIKLFTRRLQALHRIIIDGELNEGVLDLEALAHNDSLRVDFRITVMTDLADLFLVMGNMDRYLETYYKCLEWTNNDDFKIQFLERIIGVEWMYANNKDIIEHWVLIDNLLKKRAINQIATLPSTYRKTEWKSIMWDLSKSLCLLDRFQNDSTICDLCYDNILFIKNGAFRSDKILRDYVIKKGTSEQKDLLDYINGLYEHILYNGIYEPNDALAYAYELAYAEKDLMSNLPLEKEVLAEITTWKEIQANLEQDEAAIEIVEAPLMFPSDSVVSKLFALIVTPHCKYPECVELGNYYDIIDDLRKCFSQDAATINEAYLNNDGNLRHFIWDNISERLNGINRVYLSTNTLLSEINMGALILADGILASERWDIQLLTSTAELTTTKNSNVVINNAFLLGGGNFSDEKENFANANDLYDEICRTIEQRGNFKELSGAIDEVVTIKKLMDQANIKTKSCIGKDASELAFREIETLSPNIIHIATHFFCIDDSVVRNNNSFLSRLMAVDDSEGALVNTGFILANANKTWNGQDEQSIINDGVILSADIARMYLSGCEIAVMSGCQSGTGQVSYDGLLGLQSALKLAGVKTIIQSLWNVDDTVTKEFMIEFYKTLLAKKNKKIAFTEAQSAIRLKHPDPYYWAAFIMID